MKIPFGKHKGVEASEAPADYRKWLLTQDWFEKFTYLRAEIVALEDDSEETVSKPIEKKKKETVRNKVEEEPENEPFEF